MAKHNVLRFRDGYGISDLETTVAEEDSNLAQYYVGRELFVDRATNREDSASVFIGPKGVGKSAVLQMVRNHASATGNESRLIEIAPDDLAFNALINIDSRTPLLKTPSQNQWLFTSLWDYVLCAEILHRESAGYGTIEKLLTSVLGDRNRKQQAKLLKITVDDEGKHLSMTDKMLALIEAVELEGEYDGVSGRAKVTLRENGQRSDDLQLLQLISSVAKQLPKSLSHEYYVLIDDLDLHWSSTPLQNAFLAAMFLSIRKMSRERSIKFVVSLRKSIYREINLEERDKFSPYVCEVEWGKAAVKDMVESRMNFAVNIARNRVWGTLFPDASFNYMWGNTDGMPREVLRLAGACIDRALKNGEKSVSADSINEATRRFSTERRDELASLFQYQYPGLGFVTRQFEGCRKEFNIDVIQEVALKVCDMVEGNLELPNLDWATCGFDDPVALARALLSCGFLLLKSGRSEEARAPLDEEIQLLDDKKWFAIHPMYHAGLGLDGYDRFVDG